MDRASLIFGEDRKNRISRHLLFWGSWYLFFGLMHAAQPFGAPQISYFQNLPFTFSEAFFQVLPHLVFTYPMLYFVFPRYIETRRYFMVFLCVLILLFLSALAALIINFKVTPWLLPKFLPEKYMRYTKRDPNITFFMALLGSMKGGLTIGGMAVGMKAMKQWFLKEQANLKLQKENAQNQLKILTAQVHPHFLFNTLNNIYSLTQTTSPAASKMVMGMSELLRYMLYEGSKNRVPLDMELYMINEYIRLERIRYGNKLELHLNFPEKSTDLQIAPLILLPFVENCFKHGASHFLENPWMNMEIRIVGESMLMKLINGKMPELPGHQAGIGIQNVRKRLDLLYPKKYNLEIINEEDVYVVNLSLQLEKDHSEIIPSLIQPNEAYA